MRVVEVWHNVLWSRYKGRVFTELYREATAHGQEYRFFQLAETEGGRKGLGGVDLDYHRYPYELMYPGSTDELPWYRTMPRYFARALSSRADFVLIAGYSEPQNWAQLFGLLIRGTPRGVFCDSTLADRTGNWLKGIAKRFFFKRCDLVFCYGERAAELARKFGTRPDRVVRRCQAAALPRNYDVTRIEQLRREQLSATPRVLYVGRLSPEKNLDRLIEAFARYHAERPDAVLRLVGSGPLRDALADQARRLGIGHAVILPGGMSQEALASEYLAATMFVLPSLSEPWGLVVNESLCYGCPVAVSDACGCVPELVLPGRSGASFDPHSVEAITAAIFTIERDYADVDRVTRNCLDLIAGYSPEAAARQILTGVDSYFARAA